MDPGLVGPELFVGFAGRIFVAAFLLLSPNAMSGPDPRARKSRYRYKTIDTTGSYQNGEHLLGPIPGGEYNESYDLEEEAMRMDGQTEMKNKSSAPSNIKMDREEITGKDENMTSLQGIGLGATTSPAQARLIQGFTAGGGEEAVTKKFVINDEETICEEARQLDTKVNQYDIQVKRARLEAMETEFEKLSPKKIILSGIPDSRHRDGGYQIYVREQRGSMSRSTEMHSETESRQSDSIPVKEMATPIESTRRVPKKFYLSGITDQRARDEQAIQARCRDMLKEIEGDFQRGITRPTRSQGDRVHRDLRKPGTMYFSKELRGDPKIETSVQK